MYNIHNDGEDSWGWQLINEFMACEKYIEFKA